MCAEAIQRWSTALLGMQQCRQCHAGTPPGLTNGAAYDDTTGQMSGRALQTRGSFSVEWAALSLDYQLEMLNWVIHGQQFTVESTVTVLHSARIDSWRAMGATCHSPAVPKQHWFPDKTICRQSLESGHGWLSSHTDASVFGCRNTGEEVIAPGHIRGRRLSSMSQVEGIEQRRSPGDETVIKFDKPRNCDKPQMDEGHAKLVEKGNQSDGQPPQAGLRSPAMALTSAKLGICLQEPPLGILLIERWQLHTHNVDLTSGGVEEESCDKMVWVTKCRYEAENLIPANKWFIFSSAIYRDTTGNWQQEDQVSIMWMNGSNCIGRNDKKFEMMHAWTWMHTYNTILYMSC